MTAGNHCGYSLARLLLLGIGMLATAVLAARPAAADYREKVVLRFCPIRNGAAQCQKTGDTPLAGLIADSAGNLYGTTFAGGADGGGTVFELTPNADETGWAETLLYSFCNCTYRYGANPAAGVIMDGAGNLYGTTFNGGAGHKGMVFELTPNAGKQAWTETVLYSFCSQANCGNRHTESSLIMDRAGHLYGTTYDAGAADKGMVFELTPDADKNAWTETVLYNFCSRTHCADGAYPAAGLVMDGAGNLYGTTSYGGAYGLSGGTVFKLTPDGDKAAWTETVLYSFCSRMRCADGAGPMARLIMDGRGDLFGTAPNGGFGGGFGVVFELAPNATRTTWTQTVPYRFCRRAGCVDGANPVAGLIMDRAGNLYGTTEHGGIGYAGVAFELTPDKTQASGWAETVLRQFCPQPQNYCPDGANPVAGLTMDRAGNLYGTTVSGGFGQGVVFELEAAP